MNIGKIKAKGQKNWRGCLQERLQRCSQQRYGVSGLTLWQVFTLWFISLSAQAQLPTPVNPTSGAPNGNYLAFMEGWTGDAVDYIALAISGAGFLWVGWILLSKFNEARSSNDPDWGSVGLTAVIAGALLAIVSFFLNEAVGII
jgi:integrating conjugative element membrane protein (TIGR03745 family)